jgi:hypothetical protein
MTGTKVLFVKKICACTVVMLLPLLGAQDNPAIGTWKLNIAKSKFSGTPPKNATLMIEAVGDGVKTSLDEIDADDSRVGYEYTATFDDGKDYPLSGSSRPERLGGAETVALRRAGSHAYGGQFKKSGQIVMTNRTVVSKDGKTLTLTANGADSKGQPITLMTVWDKQ